MYPGAHRSWPARRPGRAAVILARVLEILGDGDGLLDEPLELRLRGGGGQPVTWRARLRDDDGRVWRAEADAPEALGAAWRPAKTPAGPVAALRSLRPVRVDVRADVEDGRGASRTVTRRLLADGVRVRRWRDGPAATLYLPAGEPVATLVADATGEDAQAVAPLAAALLASRGVRVLVAGPGRGGADPVQDAQALLARLPGGADAVPDAIVLPVPAGVPATLGDDGAAWHRLLARVNPDPSRP